SPNHGPSDMSGSGFPNLTTLTPNQRPPDRSATPAAIARCRAGRTRPHVNGTAAMIAIATGTPVNLAPAANPANKPTRAAAPGPVETSDTAAAVVITSRSKSSFPDAARNATAGHPSVMRAAIHGAC